MAAISIGIAAFTSTPAPSITFKEASSTRPEAASKLRACGERELFALAADHLGMTLEVDSSLHAYPLDSMRDIHRDCFRFLVPTEDRPTEIGEQHGEVPSIS